MGIKVGIDSGTTVTKLVAVEDGKMIARLRVDSEPSINDILVLYEALLERNGLKESDITSVNLTGVGGTSFTEKIGSHKVKYIHEFDANVLGAKYVSGDVDDFLLISLGTGTSYIHVTGNRGVHLGGLGLGGGTVRGLAKYLVGTINVKELAALSEKGDVRNVNLTMADVSQGKFDGLMEELTAANFAKVKTNASKEDLAKGIYSLVIENAIQTGSMLAKFKGINTIVLIGGLCNSEELEPRLALFSKMYPDIKYITADNGSYVTALGTALAE